VNLEFDADELSMLKNAGDALAHIAPIPSAARQGETLDRWAAVVDSGWAEIGAAVASGELPLAVAADIFRRAGGQLLVDDYVTSGYALPALAHHAAPPAREQILARLRTRRGVLLGDGRIDAIPIVTPDTTTGFCFGTAPDCDVYRLVDGPDGIVLQLWHGDPPRIRRVANLAMSAGTVNLAPTSAGAPPAPVDVPSSRAARLPGPADTGTGGGWTTFPLGLPAEALASLRVEVMLVHSAAMVGCAERLLQITCDHARGRVQFGVPIGSFQAVKHLLADVYTATVVAWNAILVATAEGADTALAPLVARLLSLDAALLAARAGAQVHGGVGFTAELNVHLFLRTILDAGQRFGSSDEIAARLGREFARTRCSP
jgi:hypothetical protein